MHTIFSDIRFGLRLLIRNPGFAAVAVLTVALGIGFNSAIFSLVDAVILRPLPYPDPQQLVGLGEWRNQRGEGYIQTGVSAPNLDDIARTGIFQQVGYFRWTPFNITEGSHPESVDGIAASAGLLPMFGIAPQLGRYLLPDETQPGRGQVAVIGHRLWQMRFGSDPAIVGKQIRLNQKQYTIVGVMPANFRFTWDQEIDVFVPLVLTAEERSDLGRGTSRDLQAQARLKPGVSVQQAQTALNVLAQRLAQQYPGSNKGWQFKVEPLHAAYHRNLEKPLLIMLGAVLFVLLIACANVANLLLARATGRRREVAIRIAIGGTRRRLITQLLTESLLLATLGGACGLFFAFVGDRFLTLGMTRSGFIIPNAKVISLDWRVLLFSLAITLATGLFFGLAPAWVMTRTDFNDSLKEGGFTTTTESGRRRLRNALVISEMALALVLLTGAGLLVRTFLHLANVDLGIDPTNVITMGIRLPDYKYPAATQQDEFYRSLLQNLARIPGIASAGAEGGGSSVFFQPQGQPVAAPGQEPTASFKIVSEDFFKAMGIRLISGREFTDHDSSGAGPVAVISESVARRYFPGANPIGSHLTLLARVYSGQQTGSGQPLEIVGIVKDVRDENVWSPEADVYVPMRQHPVPSVFLVVRTATEHAVVVPAIRNAVFALDPEQPVNYVKPMTDIIAQTYGSIRFPMLLLWIFAALALVLSGVGIFGVMSYSVSRRTQEVAIRMALGASRANVLKMVLKEALGVTALGVGIGLLAALALSHVMSSYVFGISPTDPLTFASAALLLTAIALLASYLPARRATTITPVRALRFE